MAFFLFILATATLFVRPTEIFPDLLGLPIYNALILSCAALTFPRVIAQLDPGDLARNPISVCALGILGAVVASHLAHGNLRYAYEMGTEFARIILYYFLLVALLDSTERIRRFLTTIVLLVVLIGLLSLLSYYDVITLHGVESLERVEFNAKTGEMYQVRQLQGSGIFGDPNDLCLILVTGMGAALYRMTSPVAGATRFLWGVPILFFGHVLTLTYSRGGLLALLAAAMALMQDRMGAKKSALAGAVFLPLALVLVGGRQANLDASDGSGQSRIQLWAASLATFRQAPLFGVGQGLLADTIGQESHNSFVHCFPDIGFFGGACFLGLYGGAFRALRALRREPWRVDDPELRRMRPYLTAIVAGYSAGMFTVSRSYIIPTYLVPGLVAAYVRLTMAGRREPPDRFDGRYAGRLARNAVVFLVALYLLLPLFTRFGGGP
jgi:putative inorganic carbon (HCO3(-)) transporter